MYALSFLQPRTSVMISLGKEKKRRGGVYTMPNSLS